MPKRPVAVQSDSESDDSQAKRARTEVSSDSEDEQPGPSRSTQARRGGRRARNNNDESDVEADVVIPVAVDDEEFEKQHTANVRAQIESKGTVKRGIAEYGIIEYIGMTDFMCHKNLSFKFGPQINFLIGHNGSGKSAVLSALTIALGGKTNSTGRGSGLKSFIREGQPSATVTIKIKNQGQEAYKPQEYGDSITINRRFSKEGSSSWRIEAKDGTLISSKREELSAICDHMNIQVDNPMNVLTQDAARQFLSASHPQDKYKFFLLGTQLFQLSTEYDNCLENIRKTARLLAEKKEAIPDLRSRYNQVLGVYKEAEKARVQKKKVDDLKKELAWSHVKGKEEELQKKMEVVVSKQHRIPKIEEGLQKAEAELEEQNNAVAACEGEVENLGSIDHLNERRTRLQQESRAKKETITGFGRDLKAMKTSIGALNVQVKELQSQIDTEQRRMEANSQARREELDKKIDAAKETLAEIDVRVAGARERKADATKECDDLKSAGTASENRIKPLQDGIMEAQGMARRAKENMKDMFVPYGNNIKAVLEEIGKCRWHGDAPLGPLGRYVKAREPEKWGDILRGQLGNVLTAFAITDVKDRDQLNGILRRYKNNNNIIIYEKDMFDYSGGEPPQSYHTVLRALEITDPYVTRIFINQSHIESLVLSNKRKQLHEELVRLGGGFGWSLDRFAVRVFPEGGASSSDLPQRRMNEAFALLLTGRDSQAEIAYYEQEGVRLQGELQELNQSVASYKSRFRTAKQAVDRSTAEERTLLEEHRRAKTALGGLQEEANEELPVGVAGFQSAKMEAEAEIESTTNQMAIAAAEMSKVTELHAAVLNQLNEIKEQGNEFGAKKSDLENKLQDAVTARVQGQANIKYFKDKLEKEQKVVRDAEKDASTTEQEFVAWSKKAAEFCEKVEDCRSVAVVERELTSVQKALTEREKRQGKSVEEMIQDVNKAKDALEKVDREWKQMSTLNKALRSSLLVRLHRWQEFRRHIALRCRLIFAYHLSHRGYYGKVLFNHLAQTLTLRVQTDDQLNARGTAEKDPKSLSGGEKSFSTICLLLSLWDSIGCPLRCLDEFDVFMDAVNRRISMKMMIDTATTNPDKQYILITPQDMTNIHITDNVNVLRMTDPERGNALGFTSTRG